MPYIDNFTALVPNIAIDVLENMPLLVWVKDKAGRFLFINRRYQEFFGQPPDVLLGKTAEEGLGQSGEEYTWQDQQVFEEGDGRWFKYQVDHLGIKYWTETYKAPLRNEVGEIIGLMGFSRDISQQVEMEENLRRSRDQAFDANRAKTEFLASMNHELRTPLNAIIGFAELAMMEAKEPSCKGHLREITLAAQSLLALFNDIMDMVRLESNRVPVTLINTRLWDMGEELISMYRQAAAEKGLTLTLDLAPDVPFMVVTDGAKLQQILMHLLSNAIKFTASGTVTLFFRQNRNENEPSTIDLLIGVQDTGPGIPEEKQEEIFAAFRQGEEGRGRHYSGVGLGLPICRHLTTLLKGRLMLDSAVGAGSTFTVLLSAVPVAAGIETRAPRTLPDLQGRKVMVVDDVSINRLLLTRWLEAAGAQASCATSGEDCLELAEADFPDAVLMDIVLPGIDGVETARRLRERSGKDKDLYIIALTAADKNDYEAKDFDEFMDKPVAQAVLIEALARHFNLESGEKPEVHKEQLVNFEAAEDDPAGLLNALINRASSLGTALRRQLIISEVEQFQAIIEEIAEEYSSSNLRNYADILEEQLRDFDIVALKASVAEYPRLLERIALMDQKL